MNLYKELLLDHYRYPRNRGEIPAADFSSGEHNPSCGDSVCFQGTINNGSISKLMFTGQGCVISQAAASLISEQCAEKQITEVLKIDADQLQAMIGMQLGPMRLKCLLLPLEALHKGLVNYEQSQK